MGLPQVAEYAQFIAEQALDELSRWPRPDDPRSHAVGVPEEV
jgi:hypothetical protein